MQNKKAPYVIVVMALALTWLLASCQSENTIRPLQETPKLVPAFTTVVSTGTTGVTVSAVPQASITAEPKQKTWFTPVEKTPLPPSASPSPTPEFKVCSPLVPYPLSELREIVSDPYRPPPPGKDERHHGVDFSHYRRGDLLTIEGVDVQSVLPGRIAAAIADTYPFGNIIIIETPRALIPGEWLDRLEIGENDSLYILYAHLQNPPILTLDEWVAACQVIGAVGKTGNTVEPHLHLETRLGTPSISFPSMRYYQEDATEEEKEAYLRWRISGEFRHFDPMMLLNP